MTDEEYLQNLANRLGMDCDEITEIVNCYIKAVTGKFVPLSPYPKQHVCIRPIKIKTLKERLEELMDDQRRTNYKNIRQAQ